jgi:glycosyltransferase involved in cell wall biosynthesis
LVLEKYLIPKIHLGFTVSQPIADYYLKNYKVQFSLIRNLGRFRYDNEFEGLEKDSNMLTVLYQGSVNLGRGLELAIRSMKHLDKVQLWIVGDGDIISKLRHLATHLGLKERVKFFGRIPIEKLWNYTAKADLGISLEEDLGLNYRYALPNKLFDYIQARIPVICSDLPEMATIVKQYKIGLVLKERTPVKLAESIKRLLTKGAQKSKLNSAIELAARDLCWEREEEKLITLFKRVGT